MDEAAAADLFVGALGDLTRDRSAQEWLALAGDCQTLSNVLTAVQDVAIARAASHESVWCEDGTVGEVDRGPGRVALDAADLLAPVLGASHHQAQRRVDQAVRLATGREPVPADSDARPERNGLSGLHVAMRAGRLDPYRASVVALELAECPAEVAETVVAALEPHFDTVPAAGLRRRARRLLVRISPDLLRQRAERARRETGLRRWAGEPGVDVWHGTFPTEDSARAWAAIDGLARRYVLDGVCTELETARARALTDLVLEHSHVEVQVVLAVPQGTAPAGGPGSSPDATPGDEAAVIPPSRGQRGDLVQAYGARPSEPLLVPAGWLAEQTGEVAAVVACDPETGARTDPENRLATDAYRPGEDLAAHVRSRDGGCRFPGCSVAARYCDLDHARPWPAGPTSAANLLCLCRRHHRVKQSPGWRLRLHADGIAEWTDPRGRTRTTRPLDALEAVVLRADPEPDPPPHPGHPPPLPSVLEEHLAHLLGHHEAVWQHARFVTVTVAPPAPERPPF